MPESLRGQHRWGGIALSYTGNVLEVWAQITFRGIGGGSIDETFNILEEPGSDTREAVWLIPRRSTAIEITTYLVLAMRSSGTVSSDNSAGSTYSSTYGTTNLGVFFSNGTGNNLWRVTGVEIVGTVIPSSYTGPVVIHRLIIESRSYTDNNATPYETLTNQPDTSFSGFRDDNPQSGGSNGKVYDFDAPGISPGPDAPVGSIVRRRVNFIQYTTIGNITLGDSFLNWFARESVIKTSTGDQLLNDISGDNTIGFGSTALTWNLQ